LSLFFNEGFSFISCVRLEAIIFPISVVVKFQQEDVDCYQPSVWFSWTLLLSSDIHLHLSHICSLKINTVSLRNSKLFRYCFDVLKFVQLWMGTHPKGPSLIASSGESLAKWIESHHSSLGDQVEFYNQLPFLFKVLSVNIALSIQVHPDKVCELHSNSAKVIL